MAQPALHYAPLAASSSTGNGNGNGNAVPPLIQRFVAAAPGAGAGASSMSPLSGLSSGLKDQLQQGWEKGRDELGQWGKHLKANPREAAKAAGVAVAALLGGAVIRSPNIRRQVRFGLSVCLGCVDVGLSSPCH
jgi:hypothetical protein